MSKSKLINYLLNSNLTTNYTDPYFNNVDLLLKLDKYTNTQGYPLYKDYSTNQYQIRYTKGSAINSDILFIDNFTGIDVDLGESNNINKPLIAKTGNIDIDSYLYFPNSENRALRLLSINNQVYSNYVRSTHLEVFLNGNTPIVLDDEFTIEFSFYAEDVNIPWKYQSILSAGYVFNGIGLFVGNIDIKDYVNIVLGRGYAVYLKDDVLIFFDGNIENIILENVNELEWYHICICRENVDGDLILKTYVNFIKTSEVVHTIDFSTLFTTDFITVNI